MLEVKTIMERWARLRNVFIQVRAVNWIHLSKIRGRSTHMYYVTVYYVKSGICCTNKPFGRVSDLCSKNMLWIWLFQK